MTLWRIICSIFGGKLCIKLSRLRPGDEVSGPCLRCGIYDRHVVVFAQRDDACTVCVIIDADPAGVPRVGRVYLLQSDRFLPSEAVVRSSVSIPELVWAAERALRSKLTRVENSWHESWDVISMLDFTDPCTVRFVDDDIARGHVAMFAVQLQHSARVIQRGWRRAIADPTMHLCHSRLLREFRELAAQ